MAKSGNKLSEPARKSGRKSNAAMTSESPSRKASTAKTEHKRLAPTKAQAGKTRAAAGDGDGATSKKRGAVARAASKVGTAIRSVTSKLRPGAKKTRSHTDGAASSGDNARAAKKVGEQKAARVARRESDIPMDRIAQTYTPPHTSLKGGMRGNGADRQHDQELGRGVADDRWNDEDIITNKSGDPRIGTHGRTYEPGEARAAASRNRE